MKAERDSNIELLRIFSMILVLLTHTCYVSIGPPTNSDILTSLCGSIVRSTCESLSDVGVNTFILISGWFGIRSRLNRFVEFVFQILFLEVVLYILMRLSGLTEAIDSQGWLDIILFKYGTYWFVKAYIVLYIFAPVLNAFVDHCGRTKLKYFLMSFYAFQTIYGFYFNIGWFSNGYSPLSFIGLYLLARYMRLYPNSFTQQNKYLYLFLYLIVSLLTALCSLSTVYYLNKVGTFLFQNSSPLIILSSVCFFLFFTKYTFRCPFVNYVSTSCFAVYIVHCTPFVFYPYYIDYIRYWYNTESSVIYCIYTILLMLFFLVFSIIFDKIRIFFWLLLCRIYFNLVLPPIKKTEPN